MVIQSEMELGERLAGGAYRDVYAAKNDPSLVVKVWKYEPECRHHENRREALAWEYLRKCPVKSKNFLPIVGHTADYKQVVLPRCTARAYMPHSLKVPPKWDDLHCGNVGIYENRMVILDYGGLTLTHLKARFVPVEKHFNFKQLSYIIEVK